MQKQAKRWLNTEIIKEILKSTIKRINQDANNKKNRTIICQILQNMENAKKTSKKYKFFPWIKKTIRKATHTDSKFMYIKRIIRTQNGRF